MKKIFQKPWLRVPLMLLASFIAGYLTLQDARLSAEQLASDWNMNRWLTALTISHPLLWFGVLSVCVVLVFKPTLNGSMVIFQTIAICFFAFFGLLLGRGELLYGEEREGTFPIMFILVSLLTILGFLCEFPGKTSDAPTT